MSELYKGNMFSIAYCLALLRRLLNCSRSNVPLVCTASSSFSHESNRKVADTTAS